MIPIISVVYFLLCGLICFAAPIGVAIYMRKVFYAEKSPFAAGMVLYLVFITVGKYFVDKALFGLTGLGGNLWAYAGISGFTTALLGCAARLVGFGACMPQNHETERENAIMFGAGYGGIEIIIAIGINMLSYFVFSLIFNYNPDYLLGGANRSEWEEIQQFLCNLSPVTVLWFTIESLVRLSLQIEISILMFTYVRNRNFLYFGLVFVLQWFIGTILILSNSIMSLVVTEIILALLAVGVGWLTRAIYRTKLKTSE